MIYINFTLFQQIYICYTIFLIFFELSRYFYHKKYSSSLIFLNWANKFKINIYFWSIFTGIVLFVPSGDFTYSYMHSQFWEQFTGTVIKILTNIIQHFIVHKYNMPVAKIAPTLKILLYVEIVGIEGLNWSIMITTPDLVHFYINIAYLGIADPGIILQDVVLIIYLITFCFFFRTCNLGLDLIMSKHDLIYEIKKLLEDEGIIINYNYHNNKLNNLLLKKKRLIYNKYKKKEEKFNIALLDFFTVFSVVFILSLIL